MTSEFESKLDDYAELIVKGGLNLQAGQKLLIVAPIDAVGLVHSVTAHAYRAGSPLVSVIWQDEQLTLLRFQNAPRDSFSEVDNWPIAAGLEYVEAGGAYLRIAGNNPDLLAGQDPKLVAIATKAAAENAQPLSIHVSKPSLNWTIVAYPSPGWVAQLYPELSPEDGKQALWKDIFTLTRITGDNTVGGWQDHLNQLAYARDTLNAKRFDSIHMRGEGTDLRLGLPEGHLWGNAQMTATTGITFCANIPTEEVFTTPHKDRVDGVVASSKPLSVAGSLIDGFRLRFENGKVVEYTAKQGEDILGSLLDTDDNSRQLGELALVPHNSPISQSGKLFYNTLFDENAADHLALGRGFPFALEGGQQMTPEELAAAGVNLSNIHVDFMVGTADMDVDGITAGGEVEPVMRNGEWVI